jgi:hypothetical protein
MSLLDHLRSAPPWKDAEPAVRRKAARDIADPATLDEIARTDADESVREAAARALRDLVLEGDEATGLAALPFLADPKDRVAAARSAAHEPVARAALERIEDPRGLGSVARHGRHPGLRLEALRRLRDPEEVAEVARKSPHPDATLAAVERLTDPEVLRTIAEEARCPKAARAAAAALRDRRDPAGAEAAMARGRATDRAAQTRICTAVETLTRSHEVEALQEALGTAMAAWDDLIPDVDDDLAERYAAACRAARERLRANRAGRADQAHRDQERLAYAVRHLAPREAIILRVTEAAGAAIPAILDETRWEWHQLSPEPSDEVRALGQRFEETTAAAQQRYAGWLKEQDAARQKAEREADARRRDDHAARLDRLCTGLERLLESGTLTLKKGERGLREIRAALADPPAILPEAGRAARVRRLKAALGLLLPQVKDLRDGDEWKRWANANVQEEICTLAEKLRDIASPIQAARRLTELRERWRMASAAPPDRAKALWARFKAVQDEVRDRLRAHRRREVEERAANLKRKEDLCARAEAIGDSQDWEKTAEALKTLQAEWKTIGPGGRGGDKAVWDRFHAACDRFFGRRNEARKSQRETWVKNLADKTALCVQAEACADSTDWDATSETLKRLQADWKMAGPVSRRDSEPIWKRFRTACDRFFERFKRRDQIDREVRLQERVALCAEMEAILAPEAATAAEAMADRVRDFWKRWQQGIGRDELPADLAARFDRALAAILQACPDGAAGEEFDGDRNRTRLEDLCARVEKLVGGPKAPAEEDLSPAARLATMWREALATNTIGGRQAEEARWRAAAEEARRARAAWQKIGYVPVAAREALNARFEAACSRIFAEHDRHARTHDAAPGDRRGGPRDRGPRGGSGKPGGGFGKQAGGFGKPGGGRPAGGAGGRPPGRGGPGGGPAGRGGPGGGRPPQPRRP